jgi:DHA2 family multidrug resistance protein
MFAMLAVICLVSVVFWELRQKNPVIDFHILKQRNFTLATSSMFVLGFVLYGSTALLPLFLQTLLGYTAMLSGMVLSPGGIAILLCMPLVGRLVRRVEARWLVIFGVTVSSIGLYWMSKFTLGIDFSTAMWARVVQSVGMAFLFVPISTAAFTDIARERTNYAAGLFNLARNIGGSSGIATVTTLLARRGQFHQQVLTSHLTPYDQAYQSALAGTTQMLHQHGASLPDASRQAQAVLYGTVQRQASMLAFADVFFVASLLFLAVIPLMFFMKPSKQPAQISAGH